MTGIDVPRPWRVSSERDRIDLVLRLTLVALLLRPIGDWWLRFPILGLAVTGVLIPDLLRRRELWTALAVLTLSRVVLDWPLPDNHAYLLGYWCLAVAISRFAPNPGRVLAMNARWLIALVFGLAIAWKLVLSPDFLDATFLRVTLLLDPRFEGVTRLFGGLSVDQIEAARAALERHSDGGTLAPMASALTSRRFDLVAHAMTGWTIAIEAAVALAFCWPKERGPSKLRDGLLLAFCATTYAVATVEGFGWLLITMGVAQSAPERARTRMAYLAVFALILFYREVDWLRLLASFFDRV